MTENVLPVQIVLKEGPIIIRSLNGAQVNAAYDLWNNIIASEFFPPNTDSAFYILSLAKPVSQAAEVRKVEVELIKALELLATTWPFSGGSFMIPETHEVTQIPRHESNAKEIETELLAREGLRHVESSFTANYGVIATYLQPPLATASNLAKAILNDPPLGKLLEYHQRAWVEYYSRRRTDRSSWFIHLYKIRDFLAKVYGGEVQTQSRLGISKDDWSFFGTILNNNDLRHAEISGTAPSVAHQDVDRLYRLARDWIRTHLVNQRLPVVSV